MGLVGFFLDDIIRAIVQNARREKRLNKVRKWRLANGSIREFRTVEGGIHGLRPVIDYAYEVDGERHYGSATGCSLRDGVMQLGDTVDKMILENFVLQVRYDPEDPLNSYLLNSDNPHLPFAIDHDVDL